jgi:hypothetical protein
MADINAVAEQFTGFYYLTFDSNRANLAPLYVRRRRCLHLRVGRHLALICFLAQFIYAHLGGEPDPRC